MKHPKIATISLAFALAACTAPGPENTTRLGADPALTGGTYSMGGGITVASAFHEFGGRTGLCGVWSESSSQTSYSKGKASDVLASGAAYLGDKRLQGGLDFFREVPPGNDCSNLKAPCRVTDHAWRAEYATRLPDIRLPRQIVYHDPGKVAGPIVQFRQTGPGALSGSLDPVKALFGNTIRAPLGHAPILGGGRYSSGGRINVAVELRQIGKSAYVCGVWAKSRGQSRRTEKQAPEVLARGQVLVDGKPMVRDLRFLRLVSPGRPIRNRSADCVDSGQSWATARGKANIDVRFSPFTVYAGPGHPITFVPDRPKA